MLIPAIVALAAHTTVQAEPNQHGLWYLADGSRTPHRVRNAEHVLNFEVYGSTILAGDGDGLLRFESLNGRPIKIRVPTRGILEGFQGEAGAIARVRHGFLKLEGGQLSYVPDGSRRARPVRWGTRGVQMTFRAMIGTSAGAVIATENTGLWTWREGSPSAIRVPTFSSFSYGQWGVFLESLLHAGRKTWIATASNAIWCLPDGVGRAFPVAGMPADLRDATMAFENGKVAVCSPSGLWLIDPATAKARRASGPLASEEVDDVAGRAGNLIVAAADGLWCIAASGAARRVAPIEHAGRSMFSADGSVVFEKLQGSLYSVDQGAHRVRWLGVFGGEVVDLYARPRDILFGTDQNGLWSFDRRTGKSTQLSHPPGGGVSAFRRYGKGVLFSNFQEELSH